MAFVPHYLELAQSHLQEREVNVTEAELAAQAAAEAAKAREAAAAAALEADKSAYLTRLRNEAQAANDAKAAAEAELRKMQDAQADAERAKLAADKEFEKMAAYEKERADKAVADANKAVADATAKSEAALAAAAQRERRKALEAACAAKGMRDLEDVDRLDVTKISFDEQNRPINADAAIDELAKAKPHYFKVGASDQNQRPSFRPPAPAAVTTDFNVNAYDLTDAEFDAQYAQLGKRRLSRA